MVTKIHLIKLCVGVADVEELAAWQAQRGARDHAAGLDPRPVHVTRMRPKRADDLLTGGSLFWVVKGLILVRQRILALEPRTGEDGIARCAIHLDPELRRTVPVPRRPFQGWRYLLPGDAPADLGRGGAGLPAELAAGLAEIGVV